MCLVPYCSCLSCGAHTHTHTHTSNYFHFREGWCVCCSRCVWSHVTATAAYRSSSLATQDSNSDRLLNERHRPLSTGSGFVHRKNSWMLHAECRYTKHTHTHCTRICDKTQGSGSSATSVPRDAHPIFTGFLGLSYICTTLLELQWTQFQIIYIQDVHKWDNSVGRAAFYLLDGSGIEFRWGRGITPVQRGHAAHPASYTMGTGSSGVKRPGSGVDHPPYLAPRLKKEYSSTSTPLWVFVVWQSRSRRKHPFNRTENYIFVAYVSIKIQNEVALVLYRYDKWPVCLCF